MCVCIHTYSVNMCLYTSQDKARTSLPHPINGSTILERNFTECMKSLNSHTLPIISLLDFHPENVYIMK